MPWEWGKWYVWDRTLDIKFTSILMAETGVKWAKCSLACFPFFD